MVFAAEYPRFPEHQEIQRQLARGGAHPHLFQPRNSGQPNDPHTRDADVLAPRVAEKIHLMPGFGQRRDHVPDIDRRAAYAEERLRC